jgi:EKC/KEOPS complex subunit CGI121/TPRKB
MKGNIIKHSHMETCVYSSTVVHIALYTGVSNAATLRQRIINAASATGPEGDAEREAVNFAFIDARLVSPRGF